MRNTNPSHFERLKPAGPIQPGKPAPVNPGALDFVPSTDEIARRAYFAYVNEGSPEGRNVQHWLMAETELIAERGRTRTHGFHNQN